MQNHYPWWKNLILVILLVLGLLYASPNLFGEDPSVQISAKDTAPINAALVTKIEQTLKADKVAFISAKVEGSDVLVRFPSTDVQLKARDDLKATLGNNYIVALNLASRTPGWLTAIGAQPMKLGLDLRGGVHFLLQVDTNALVKARMDGDLHTIGEQLRQDDFRYAGITQQKNGLIIHFRDLATLNKANGGLTSRFHDYQITPFTKNGKFDLQMQMSQAALYKIADYAIDQTISIMKNRVNQLGVSEAIVQREGQNQVSVDLPGIQDTTRAKDIIGKTATLRFQMVDEDHDVTSALAGDVPVGSRLYKVDGRPILLKNKVILRGSSITFATASFSQAGRPSVNVRLGGGGESMFVRTTAANVGKEMAVVYVETHAEKQKVNGKLVTVHKQDERVISVATIQSALGNNFEITGLDSVKYAQNLALLLRSGALVAPVDPVQELTVGPSMGKANIHMGLVSLIVGFLLVVFFMAIYYRFFGLLADMALLLNLIFIVAILSLLGATLTMPGMAGLVLTVGMAVDANVLIYERIREELRLGISPQAAIHAGYERAFTTIVDSNVTTLIVAIVLFALGSGSVKGFAVILTIGLMTSMVTSIVYTRAVANWVYGRRKIKHVSVGIKV